MIDTQLLENLRAQSDDPLCAYIYDLPELRRHAQSMVNQLPDNVELFYAAKANPDANILATLAPIVAGFEAASGGELRWLQQQQPGIPLIFGGPGKMDSELRLALQTGVDALHVESLTELQRLATLSDQLDCSATVFLRMNITLNGVHSTRLAMGGKPTPFGIDPSELDTALKLIARNKRLQLAGFHFHSLSHQLDDLAQLALIQHYCRTVKHWCRDYHLTLPVLNVGGGMGIDYAASPKQLTGTGEWPHFNWTRFCENLKTLITQEAMIDTCLRFECGRYVTAHCGYYAVEVLDIKRNHGEYFAICRGGTHHFRTPAAQAHNHPFVVIPGTRRGQTLTQQSVTLVGQLCTPKDVFARQQQVASIAIGDTVVFPLAGAYAWNISHQNFLMHAPPLFHMLESKKT